MQGKARTIQEELGNLHATVDDAPAVVPEVQHQLLGALLLQTGDGSRQILLRPACEGC